MEGWVLAGDVVASRRYVDHAALLAGLDRSLAVVNEAMDPPVGLRRLADDQFGGGFRGLAEVVMATVRLRIVTDSLVLATVDGEDEPVDVRVGLAHGDLDAEFTTGSAWDDAVMARREAQELPDRSKWPPSLRTVVAADSPRAPLANAYLVLQDQLLARMDARDRRALVGLLDSERQVDIAEDLGVTQPAVARRVRDRGALAITRALRVLADDG